MSFNIDKSQEEWVIRRTELERERVREDVVIYAMSSSTWLLVGIERKIQTWVNLVKPTAKKYCSYLISAYFFC